MMLIASLHTHTDLLVIPQEILQHLWDYTNPQPTAEQSNGDSSQDTNTEIPAMACPAYAVIPNSDPSQDPMTTAPTTSNLNMSAPPDGDPLRDLTIHLEQTIPLGNPSVQAPT
jgi:hypothetical protein